MYKGINIKQIVNLLTTEKREVIFITFCPGCFFPGETDSENVGGSRSRLEAIAKLVASTPAAHLSLAYSLQDSLKAIKREKYCANKHRANRMCSL
jgi:hypothetical protein